MTGGAGREGRDERPWVAYYHDWSGFAFFANEIDALRYAVEKSMQVAQIDYGQDVREQVNR